MTISHGNILDVTVPEWKVILALDLALVTVGLILFYYADLILTDCLFLLHALSMS